MQNIKHFGLSIKFWNRITTDPAYLTLYCKIRNSNDLKLLTFVNDNYGPAFRWSEVKGKSVKLEEIDLPFTAQDWRLFPATHPARFSGAWVDKPKNELWKGWDAFQRRSVRRIKFPVKECYNLMP